MIYYRINQLPWTLTTVTYQYVYYNYMEIFNPIMSINFLTEEKARGRKCATTEKSTSLQFSPRTSHLKEIS